MTNKEKLDNVFSKTNVNVWEKIIIEGGPAINPDVVDVVQRQQIIDLLKAMNAQLAYMCRDIRNSNDNEPS